MIDPRISIEVYAVAPAKLTSYLLNLHHEDGASKAAFFIGRGFSPGMPEHLDYALREHGRTGELESVATDEFGMIFSIRGGALTPHNRTMHVRTVWAVRTSAPTIAHLVTAYPGTRS